MHSSDYDDLDPEEQARQRAEWDAKIAARLQVLKLEEEFRAKGRSWVELDDDGKPTRREGT